MMLNRKVPMRSQIHNINICFHVPCACVYVHCDWVVLSCRAASLEVVPQAEAIFIGMRARRSRGTRAESRGTRAGSPLSGVPALNRLFFTSPLIAVCPIGFGPGKAFNMNPTSDF